MRTRFCGRTMVAALACTLALAGCIIDDSASDENAQVAQDTAGTTATPAPAPQPTPDLVLEVDISARQLRVLRGGQTVESHPVAVGMPEWPTRPGEWTIRQVVWNPRWEPPTDEEWAEDEEAKEPGEPDNPLGLAQLVYDAPRSIHGTNEPESLGKAESHGSIRVSNEVAVQLARMVMEAGGAARDEAWYRRAQENRTERQEVVIPNPVPIRVIGAGGSTSDSTATR